MSENPLYSIVEKYSYSIQVALDSWQDKQYQVVTEFRDELNEWNNFVDYEAIEFFRDEKNTPHKYGLKCYCWVCCENRSEIKD